MHRFLKKKNRPSQSSIKLKLGDIWVFHHSEACELGRSGSRLLVQPCPCWHSWPGLGLSSRPVQPLTSCTMPLAGTRSEPTFPQLEGWQQPSFTRQLWLIRRPVRKTLSRVDGTQCELNEYLPSGGKKLSLGQREVVPAISEQPTKYSL